MKHEEVFWDLIDSLETTGMLSHVMIVGSWAEYLYSFYFNTDYMPGLKTHDIDVLYGNPFLEVDGSENLVKEMQGAGFLTPTEGGSIRAFYKEGLEVEFLTGQLGTGPGLVQIPHTEILAEKIPNVDMLTPIEIEANNHTVKVPSPASYICHKLFINPYRRPESKRPKDIETVRQLLAYLEKHPNETDALKKRLSSLSEERQQQIRKVAAENALELP